MTEQSCETADERIISRQYFEMADRAIARLPEKRKTIFLMRTREELSLDEIAARLSISKSVVKKQLYAAIAFVRNSIHHNEITMLMMISLIFNML
jgi:RNA polymerase sigma-19 factor, ECF subfamily